MKKEKISLQEYVEKCGSAETAASKLEISYFTLKQKWLKKKCIPNLSGKKRLEKKNIKKWWE